MTVPAKLTVFMGRVIVRSPPAFTVGGRFGAVPVTVTVTTARAVPNRPSLNV